MTLADDLKPIAHSIRAIPGQLGIRPYSVEVIRRVWSGAHTGDGDSIDLPTAITEAGGQPPRVRALNGEEKALLSLDGTVWQIGPITPEFAAGGTALETLSPSELNAGSEFYYRLTGPEYPQGALMRLVEIQTDRALGYRVIVKPVEETKL